MKISSKIFIFWENQATPHDFRFFFGPCTWISAVAVSLSCINRTGSGWLHRARAGSTFVRVALPGLSGQNFHALALWNSTREILGLKKVSHYV